MGAVLGVRLAKMISQAIDIPIGKHTFWTDSTDVLHWIKGQCKSISHLLPTECLKFMNPLNLVSGDMYQVL
jgi:hypothetical protein